MSETGMARPAICRPSSAISRPSAPVPSTTLRPLGRPASGEPKIEVQKREHQRRT